MTKGHSKQLPVAKAAQKAPEPADTQESARRLGEILKPVTGSTHGGWNRHLLDHTRDVMKHGHANRGKDSKADLHAEMGLTMAALEAFKPTDAIEGMLASQAVALHEASVHCFRLAMVPEQPFEVASKCRKDGANLSRAFADTLDALARHRGKGPQVIRVEKMLVAEGGQAVVGNVTTQSPQALPPAPAAAPLALEQNAPPMPMPGHVPIPVERGRG